jgi:hypothetical protein
MSPITCDEGKSSGNSKRYGCRLFSFYFISDILIHNVCVYSARERERERESTCIELVVFKKASYYCNKKDVNNVACL